MRHLALILPILCLLLCGCNEVQERAVYSLPPVQSPTSAQLAVQQQIANSHDRELALQSQLGAVATTLRQQEERVAKAEHLVEEVRAQGAQAVREARGTERAQVQSAADQATRDAKSVHAAEVEKLKADTDDARKHTLRLMELALAVLGVIALMVALEVPVERSKALLFASGCAGIAAVLIFVEAALAYIPWAIGACGLVGGIYLARRYGLLHRLTAELAMVHLGSGFANLENRALVLWHDIATHVYGSGHAVVSWIETRMVHRVASAPQVPAPAAGNAAADWAPTPGASALTKNNIG